MADENLRASLFGPSPEEVAMARRAQDRNYSMQKAQLQPGRMGVVAMGNAGAALGRVAGNALGGRDPMQDKAAAMQEAKQEVMQTGISLMDNPQEYYKAAFVALSRRGLTDEAAKVRAMMQQEQSAAAKGQMDERGMRVKETEAGASALNARVNEYKALNPQADPGSLAEVQKLTAQLEDPTLTPETRAAIEARVKKLTTISEPASTSIEIKNEANQNKNRGALALTELTGVREKGTAADLLRRQTGALRNQLTTGNFDPGTLAATRGTLAGAAQYFGLVDTETLAAMRQDPNDASVMRSLGAALVGSTASSLQYGDNRNSAAELKLFTEAAPNITQTAQGMYVLNELIDSQAAYDQRLRDYATEVYSNMPPEANDAEALVAIDRWKRENPYVIDPKTMDRLKKHAQIVERGKTASVLDVMNPSKNKAGRLYRDPGTGQLIIFRGIDKATNEIIADPAL